MLRSEGERLRGAADVLDQRLFDSRQRPRVLCCRSWTGDDDERETRCQDC